MSDLMIMIASFNLALMISQFVYSRYRMRALERSRMA